MTTDQIIESVINKSFDPIYNKTKDISNYLSSISVIHRTDIQNLPNIMSEGLKIEKSVTPTGATEIIKISKRIKKELSKPEDRYKTIYATFNDKELTDSVINELQLRKETLIEFKINVDDLNIFVADFDSISKAIFNQIDFNRTKNERYLYDTLHGMERNLYDYWNSFIPISEYVNERKYDNPEILIFHVIEPTDLNILIKQGDKYGNN